MATETKRQLQVAEIVRRHFSTLLLQEGTNIYGSNTLVTVTNVKVSPDLNIAKIYLSVYNTDNKQGVIMELEENSFRLRQAFSGRVRRHLRRIPEIQFYLDDTLDEMYRLNNLFDRLEREDQMGKEE